MQGYVHPTLKKYKLLNLELTEFQTGHIFDRRFRGNKLLT